MYLKTLLPAILLSISATHASTTDQIDELSTNLAGTTKTLDLIVEQLTTASNPATASVRVEYVVMTAAGDHTHHT